jgi:hypothetical protein
MFSDNMFTIKEVSKLGADNGFTMVLDFHFGQNQMKSTSVTHKLFVHDRGVVPDKIGLFGQGIDIVGGKKHDIALGAGHFQSTSGFKLLDYETRYCLLDSEMPAEATKIFKKYTMVNCMTAKLIDLSIINCNCTPWDMIPFLGNSNDTEVVNI